MAQLVVALEDLGEHRLAGRLARGAAGSEDGLVLAQEERRALVLALTRHPIPELAELSRMLEERSSLSGRTPLSREERELLREKRMAANEAFFRNINERLERDSPESRPLIVVCECADEDCAQRLEVTRREYEKARSEPTLFVIAHGHSEPEIEEVVLRTDRFEMVRKVGVGVDVVTRLDT